MFPHPNLQWLMGASSEAVAAPTSGSYPETSFVNGLSRRVFPRRRLGLAYLGTGEVHMRRGKRILLLLFADGSGAGFPFTIS